MHKAYIVVKLCYLGEGVYRHRVPKCLRECLSHPKDCVPHFLFGGLFLDLYSKDTYVHSGEERFYFLPRSLVLQDHRKLAIISRLHCPKDIKVLLEVFRDSR